MTSQMASFLKLTLVGDGGVGKSCLILQYMYGDVSGVCFQCGMSMFISFISSIVFSILVRGRVRADESGRLSAHHSAARRRCSNRYLGHGGPRRLSGRERRLLEAWRRISARLRLDQSRNVRERQKPQVNKLIFQNNGNKINTRRVKTRGGLETN